jgi:hypothetical protein
MAVNTEAVLAMLDAFTSAGAQRFDLTITSRAGEKLHFRRGVTATELRRMLPLQIADAARHEENVIVRPHADRVAFIQLDDLGAITLSHLEPAALLSLETSPGNYQAWVALPAEEAGGDFLRRLRKGSGADDTASGATRVAGSRNFKDKYAPDFPTVALHHATPGLITSRTQLEALHLVAAPEPHTAFVPFTPPASSRSRSRNRGWPSYERCLQGAPPTRDGDSTDTSRADFTWCMIACSWGWPTEQVAERLLELSAKAHENGERYALLTAQKAAAAAERNARART